MMSQAIVAFTMVCACFEYLFTILPFQLGVVAVNSLPTAVPASTSDVKCSNNGHCHGDEQCVQGVCVSVTLEERCPTGMHFSQCGSACPERCNQTKPAHCVKMCVAGCVCDEGLVLDGEGGCVDRALCQATLVENVGEAVLNGPCHKSKCSYGTVCENGTCRSKSLKLTKRSSDQLQKCQVKVPPYLKPGCIYEVVLDEQSCTQWKLKCNHETATKFRQTGAAQVEECGLNEVFSQCTNICPEKNCGNLDLPFPCFSLRCGAPGCRCKDGFVYMSGNKSEGCVTQDRCAEINAAATRQARDLVSQGRVRQPVRCAVGEEYRECGTACEPTCDMPEPKICTMQCIVNVCQCREGNARNAQGQCIPKTQCPSKSF